MAIEPAYTDLIGMNLLKGFRRQVKERFGHVAGCTHTTELSQVLPTAAVQTMANQRRQESNPNRRPFQLDGCHALRTDGPVVAEHYPSGTPGIALRHPPVRPPIHLLSHVLTGNT